MSFLKKYWFLLGFSLSVLIVLVVRFLALAYPDWDAVALLETASRWSQGLGLTSSVFIDHPYDLAAEPQYPNMTWWAPGAPLFMGLLLQLGWNLEWAYKTYMLLCVVLAWLGWLLIAQRYLASYLRANFFAGIIFALLPLHFTPMLDSDEMLGWAIVPWLGLAVASLLSRRWFIAASLCGLICAVGYFFRFSVIQYLAVALFTIVLMPIPWIRKITSTAWIILLFSLVFLGMSIWPGQGAEYLNKSNIGLGEQAKIFVESIGSTGIRPIHNLFRPVLPGSVNSLFVEINKGKYRNLLGWLTAIVWFFAGLVILKIYLVRRVKQKKLASLLLVYSTVILSLPLFLIAVTIKNNHSYSFVFLDSYYVVISPAWLIALILLLRLLHIKNRWVTTVLALLSVYFLFFAGLLLIPKPNAALANLKGYSFQGDEDLRKRHSPVIVFPGDMVLSAIEGQPSGIVFTQHPHYYSLIYGYQGHSFRGGPPRSFWKKAYASNPVTLYFILPENEPPMPFKHVLPGMLDKDDTLPLPELQQLPGWRKLDGVISEFGKHVIVYRADIPAGWRGAELFENSQQD